MESRNSLVLIEVDFLREDMNFQKFIYWLEEGDFLSLKNALVKKGISMNEIRKAVCVPLSRNISIGFVPPDTWQKYELCKRQLSWYRISPHAGQALVMYRL